MDVTLTINKEEKIITLTQLRGKQIKGVWKHMAPLMDETPDANKFVESMDYIDKIGASITGLEEEVYEDLIQDEKQVITEHIMDSAINALGFTKSFTKLQNSAPRGTQK